jgi:hypothetical protein
MALAMLKMQQGMGVIEECVKTVTSSFPKGDIVRLQAVVDLVTKIGEKLIETGSIATDSLGVIQKNTTALRNAMILIPIGATLLVGGRYFRSAEGTEPETNPKNYPYLATQVLGAACIGLAFLYVTKSYFTSTAYMNSLDKKIMQICK